jgi:hypothetical protein
MMRQHRNREDEMEKEKWFAFKAYNQQTLYGFGTADDADKYEDVLNEGRDINMYAAYPLSDEDATELDLENWHCETFNIDYELSEARIREARKESY